MQLIAFYLPQFHPIPENDAAWGEGFTEWSNVKKARPLFSGHQQPKQPSELGYYTLEDEGIQIKQAELALEHGIGTFAYWYYWMGQGRRLLEKPLDAMINNKKIPIDFCLAWANESWTGVWHGRPDQAIAKQIYGDEQEIRLHSETLSRYMQDPRYKRVKGKAILLIYKPLQLPENYIKILRKALGERSIEIYVIAIANSPFDWQAKGFDGINLNLLGSLRAGSATDLANRIGWGLRRRIFPNHAIRKIAYTSYLKWFRRNLQILCADNTFPTCIPNWDNSPRCGRSSLILTGSSPELYKIHLKDCLSAVASRDKEDQIIFIKSWNEWAEGNYLEPDRQFDRKYLEATLEIMSGK